jgi:putative transposase
MQLRNKIPKRRVKAKLREDRAEAVRPNDVWAMGFVHDQLATGRKIRVLTVVDTFRASRRCSIRGSATAARTWSRPWIGCAGKPDIPRPSVAISTFGPISAASSSTSRAPASRPIMLSSKRSTAVCARSA